MFAPLGRPRYSKHARSGAKPGRAGTWRDRLLAAGVTLAVGGLLIVVSPARAGSDYLLLSRDRLLSLPTHGNAWDYVVDVARSGWPSPELDDQDNKTNVQALAAALVYARTGNSDMRAKARGAIERMIPTYNLSEGSGLGPARQIAGWALTADLIGLDGSLDGAFRDLLRRALSRPIGTHSRWGGSLRACHEDSDNNWGAWCGTSRIAAALYLGDAAELDQAERVYRGFLGDRAAWSHFRGQGSSNGVLNTAIRTWSCDASPDAYVPTNPDCGGRSGAFPADASRLGAYSLFDAMYQSETTAGIVLSTELLHQAGYSRSWARDALARIAWFDYKHGAWNLGTVQYHWPWLINKRLGTNYPTVAARYGRTFGYTDWLYGSGGSDDGPDRTPDPTPDPTPEPTREPTADRTPDPRPSRNPKKGRGHNKIAPTASPAPALSTIDGSTPIGPSGTLSTTGWTSGQADSPGRTGAAKDGKAKSPADAKQGRQRTKSSEVTQETDPASISTQLIAVTILAGMLMLILLQPRRRRGPS